MGLGLWVTALAVVLGYPVAYGLARGRHRWKTLLRLCVVAPLLVSVVIRTYGWIVLLANNGLVNQVLRALGLVEEPVRFMFTLIGVTIGLVHFALPVAIIEAVDPSLEEAARGLGAGRWATFWRVTLPLTLPGVAAGSMLVFALTVAAFVTPALTLFVTHDEEEALTMADEIVVMAGGRIVQVGTPAELYDRPATRFVAHFVGESNLETGRVETTLGPGAWRVETGGFQVVATGDGAWRPGDAVAVVVRPERIRLGGAPPAGGEAAGNAVAGTVEDCVFHGAFRRYRVRLPHGQIWSVDEPAGSGDSRLPGGAAVWLAWRPEDCRAVPDGPAGA